MVLNQYAEIVFCKNNDALRQIGADIYVFPCVGKFGFGAFVAVFSLFQTLIFQVPQGLVACDKVTLNQALLVWGDVIFPR